MIDLPTPPKRIARLPKDRRGYPVPWFLAWMKGGHEVSPYYMGAEPDFRVIKHGARELAWKKSLCWICGDPMGVHKVYVIGPMCVVNRTTMEPASHRECAEYAARACPFLVKPRMRRLPMDDLKGKDVRVDGEMIPRNPGAVCLYETPLAHPFKDGKGGWLIRLEDPVRVDWWAEGRQATREEVLASMQGGLPELYKLAKAQGQEAIDELDRLGRATLKLLPAAA
jgi:hypothetical protein